MDLNRIIKDKIIPILRDHMVKKILKMTNTWIIFLTKTKKMQNIYKKEVYSSKI